MTAKTVTLNRIETREEMDLEKSTSTLTDGRWQQDRNDETRRLRCISLEQNRA